MNKDWSGPFHIEDLTVHRDPRGALYEAMRFTSQDIPKGGQVYIYTIAPGARRGDHFHNKKSEWFLCVAGVARLLMKTADGKTVNEVLNSEQPKLIHAAPGTSHALLNEQSAPAVIVAYSSKEFDPSDPDTVMKAAD